MSKPPKSGHPRWWLLALGLTCAWALFLTFFGPKGPRGDLAPPRLEPQPPTSVADYAWTLEGPDGKPVDFGRFRGRAVFLNIWATWCPPCLDELPAIANLAANPRLRDVAFLCASTDDDPEVLRRFLAGHAWKFPIARATSLPPAFQTAGIPATFLIAPDGKIVATHAGPAQWDAPDVVDLLERLAKPPAGGAARKP